MWAGRVLGWQVLALSPFGLHAARGEERLAGTAAQVTQVPERIHLFTWPFGFH